MKPRPRVNEHADDPALLGPQAVSPRVHRALPAPHQRAVRGRPQPRGCCVLPFPLQWGSEVPPARAAGLGGCQRILLLNR